MSSSSQSTLSVGLPARLSEGLNGHAQCPRRWLPRRWISQDLHFGAQLSLRKGLSFPTCRQTPWTFEPSVVRRRLWSISGRCTCSRIGTPRAAT